MLQCCFWLIFFNPLVFPQGMWDLSPQTRGWTHTSSIGPPGTSEAVSSWPCVSHRFLQTEQQVCTLSFNSLGLISHSGSPCIAPPESSPLLSQFLQGCVGWSYSSSEILFFSSLSRACISAAKCFCDWTFADTWWASRWPRGQESAGSAGDAGSIPGSGRSPGGGHGTRCQFLAWEIPWTEEPGGLRSLGAQKSQKTTEWLNSWSAAWERTSRARIALKERPPHSLNWRSRPLGQAWEGSLEPGVSRSFKGIELGSAVSLNQGSDLGLADLGRLGLQHPLELCFTKALGLILSLWPAVGNEALLRCGPAVALAVTVRL